LKQVNRLGRVDQTISTFGTLRLFVSQRYGPSGQPGALRATSHQPSANGGLPGSAGSGHVVGFASSNQK